MVDRRKQRYVCLDFETNGIAKGCAPPKPWQNYPTQVALVAVDYDEVVPLWSSLISGAETLTDWVVRNCPHISLEALRGQPTFEEVVQRIRETLQDGDTIVCHNASYDLDRVLKTSAQKKGVCVSDILSYARFCTMDNSYMTRLFGKRWQKLQTLCDHFEVSLEGAHDATADATALAHCVREALRRGVMMPTPIDRSNFFVAPPMGKRRRVIRDGDVTVSVHVAREEFPHWTDLLSESDSE